MRYGLSILVTGLALVSWLVLGRKLQPSPFPLFVVAILISARYGGRRPALLAWGLSTLALIYYYLPPHHSLGMPRSHALTELVVLGFVGLYAALAMTERAGAESERARQLISEREARAKAETAEMGLRFLSEASIALASSLDYETTLTNVARLAVPHVADWCVVHIAEEDGVHQLAAAHVDPAKMELARDLEKRIPFDPHAPTGAAKVLRTGEPELIEEINDDLLLASIPDADLLETIRQLGLKSSMVVPLLARGRTVGAITFVSAESAHRFGPSDLALAQDLARRAGVAVDNARLHRDALRMAAEQAAILGQMADCVAMADMEGRIVYMNDAARKLPFPAGAGGLIPLGPRPPDTQIVDGDAARLDSLPLRRAVRGERIYEERWLLTAADGTQVTVQGSAAPVVTEEGIHLGALCTYRDVSEQVDLERQKDGFLSSAAHDLKTPLTSIKGMAQMLRRRAARANTAETEQLLEGLKGIDGTATRMTALVNELLDVTRIQMAQPLDLDRRSVDLVSLTRQVVRDFQSASASHPVEVVSTASSIPGNWDSIRLERVLTNLLSNAVRYSPPGSPVGVNLGTEQLNGATWATLSVTDNGLGIPRDDLPHVFERFFRARNVQDRIPGTGIGLASAQQIVKQHGGTIDADSHEGEGATFTVRLPGAGVKTDADKGDGANG